jgi:ketosteroid isomerase-like protein
MDADKWIETYARAWRERDVDLVADLFTDDATYRSHPFREPYHGRTAIREYWRGATDAQADLDLRFGRPIVDGDGRRAAVEWWASVEDDEDEVTLPGCLVLRFAEDGRCEELREYWHVESGRQDPPTGWGA